MMFEAMAFVAVACCALALYRHFSRSGEGEVSFVGLKKGHGRIILPDERLILHEKVFRLFSREIDLGRQRSLDELQSLTVYTTAQGPWTDDVFLALAFDDETWILPPEHPSHQPFLESLTPELELDHQQFIQAMCSTDNKSFLIWSKP